MINLTEKVAQLNEWITAGKHAEAIDLFYAEDTQMQENEQAPRQGKAFCVAHERKNLANVKSVKSTLLNQAIDLSKNVVLSEWEFEFTYLNDKVFRITEASVQHWVNGLVQKEKFYYKEPIQVK